MSQEKKSNLIQIDEHSSIVTSTIYKLNNPGEYSEKYSYSRYGNPTRDKLESSLAQLDNAKFALTYSSKTAGSLAILSTLNADDLIICSDVLSCEKFKAFGFKVEYKNCDDLKSFTSSLNSITKMVWIESQTALLTVYDIKSLADIVHANSKAVLVVDNSLLTQRPLEFGADAVIYSLGEFIGGHDDVSAGAVTTNDQKLYEKIKYHQYSSGAVPSPFDCYIISRSLKTLSLRMKKQSKNAATIAQFLENHPQVDQVFHPSLKSHFNYDLALSHFCGYPAIVTFRIKENLVEAETLIKLLKTISVTENIGSVQSSLSLPWTMSYSHLPENLRLQVGVTRNLVRLSIGIEDVNELIADLNNALTNITHSHPESGVNENI